jgi:hypothetical protein
MNKKIPFYLFYLAIIVISINFLFEDKIEIYNPADDLLALESLDDKQFDSITLGLESYKGVMLAVNFLQNVKLYSIEDSYFPKVEYRPERITIKDPLLTTSSSCLLNGAAESNKLSENFVLIFKARQMPKDIFYFNLKPYCNGMKLENIYGLSVPEPWGVWTDGNTTAFSIEMDESTPVNGKLLINVRPVINPNVINDVRIVEVVIDGNYKKLYKFTSIDQSTISIDYANKKPGSVLSVVLNHINPMRFSDISGDDNRSVSLGLLSAKLVDRNGLIEFDSVKGGYNRETDGLNWWYWVESKISFVLHSISVPDDVNRFNLKFEYSTRGKQALVIKILTIDGEERHFKLQSNSDDLVTFDRLIDISPNKLTVITFETNGLAHPLSDQDTRLASWMIRNVNLTPINP